MNTLTAVLVVVSLLIAIVAVFIAGYLTYSVQHDTAIKSARQSAVLLEDALRQADKLKQKGSL